MYSKLDSRGYSGLHEFSAALVGLQAGFFGGWQLADRTPLTEAATNNVLVLLPMRLGMRIKSTHLKALHWIRS
ncbi:MAG: hypothetical protein ACOY9D_04380 [Pseudomonadota bacterium]